MTTIFKHSVLSPRCLSGFVASLVALLTLVTCCETRGEAVRGNEEDDYSRQVIRMTVTPADEPVPTFKYRLTYRPHELVRGNSVAHYMRAFPEGGLEQTWKYLVDHYGEEVDDWYGDKYPISKLPIDKVIEAASHFDRLTNDHVLPASRCRDTDWGVAYEDIRGPETISFLLPEIQSMRSVCRAMSLQTRVAIAQQHYDRAIELMRANYRLGRDVGKQPILVSGLVGIAVQNITTSDNMVDLIAAPDSPNMYWALSELPRPQVSLRDAVRLELAIGPRMFPILDHPEQQEHAFEEWNALWLRDVSSLVSPDVSGLVDSPLSSNSKQVQSLLGMGAALAGYSHSKERLVAWGYKADEVEQMAVGQVMAIYQAGAYQRLADRMERSLYVDFPAAKELNRDEQQMFSEAGVFGSSPDRELLPIASLLLPAVTVARTASIRTDRELDAVRVIEALRMHAAQNDGKWPKTLDEVTCVPVPNNPATGKPFDYHVEGEVAVLLLPLSDGLRVQRRYELTLAK